MRTRAYFTLHAVNDFLLGEYTHPATFTGILQDNQNSASSDYKTVKSELY